jgi:hypothetical protein
MFAAMVMILLSKRLMVEYGALQVTACMIAIGALALLIWIETTRPLRIHFSHHVWVAVIAQGILATTAAYVFWNWGLARVLWWEHCLVCLSWGRALVSLGILGGALILIAAAYFSRREPV